MKRLLAVLVAGLALTGCFHIRYVNEAPAAADPAYTTWHNDFAWGLVEVSPPEDVSKACPQGYGLVKSEESFLAGLVNTVTIGIYNPSDVLIYCTAKK
jgi:hypothetical protein